MLLPAAARLARSMGVECSRGLPWPLLTFSRSHSALQERFRALRKQLVLSEGELWSLFLAYCRG